MQPVGRDQFILTARASGLDQWGRMEGAGNLVAHGNGMQHNHKMAFQGML